MQFIDKQDPTRSAAAHSVVEQFVNRAWDSQAKRYVKCNYKTFKRTCVHKLQPTLMEEQSERCCYCMRRLQAEHITWEHVIPHHVPPKDTAYYYKRVPWFNGLVARQLLNNKKKWTATHPCDMPPYPHFCAYENLVLSCDGEVIDNDTAKLHQTCNNKRGNTKIEPIFFCQLSPDEWNYEANGHIYCDDKYDDTVMCLNLQHPTLLLIRKAWASIIKAGHDTEDVRQAINNEDQRMEILSTIPWDTNEQETLSTDLYWQLLCQFDWFATYYANAARQ